MRLRYTLIFVVDDIDSPTRFLLLRRSREPDRLRWNGVGGKIEPGETPLDGAVREVREETGAAVRRIAFRGIVTWNADDGMEGMYVYLAEVDNPGQIRTCCDEGQLAWWTREKMSRHAHLLVDNLSFFLPRMLRDPTPREHRCHYDRTGLVGVFVHDLPLLPDGAHPR